MIVKNVKQQEANLRQLVILVSTVFIWKITNVPSVNCLAPFVHRKMFVQSVQMATYLITINALHLARQTVYHARRQLIIAFHVIKDLC